MDTSKNRLNIQFRPPPFQNGSSSKNISSNHFAAKRLARHSNTSPKQQRRPLPSLLSDSSFLLFTYLTAWAPAAPVYSGQQRSVDHQRSHPPAGHLTYLTAWEPAAPVYSGQQRSDDRQQSHPPAGTSHLPNSLGTCCSGILRSAAVS